MDVKGLFSKKTTEEVHQKPPPVVVPQLLVATVENQKWQVKVTDNTIQFKMLMNGVDEEDVNVSLTTKQEAKVQAKNETHQENHEVLIPLLPITRGNFSKTDFSWRLQHGDLYLNVTGFKSDIKKLKNGSGIVDDE